MSEEAGNQTPNTSGVGEDGGAGAGPDGGKLRTGDQTPATVDGTEHGDHLGVLRFDFGGDAESLRHVSREEWFDTFDSRRLNLIYQEERSDGSPSDFFRLESPDREDA